MRLSSVVPCLALLAGLVPAAAHADVALAPAPGKSDAAQSNAFSVAMYGKIKDQKGNLFFSGTSLRDALGIAYLGAGGKTSSQMATALDLDPDHAKSAANAKTEIADWKLAQGSAELSIANRMWSERSFTMLPTFTTRVQDAYGSPAMPVDFIGNPEGSRATINAWVGKETHGKIPDLLPPDSLTPQTRLVITNAIYFKGQWAKAFQTSDTRDEAFSVDGTTSRNVPMMHQTNTFGVKLSGDVKVLEMKYDKSDLAMDVLLPSDVDGLPKLEASLTAERLTALTGGIVEGEVQVTMPKTTFTWGGSMTKPLKELGMTDAFSHASDFSGIAGGADLFISDVVHKAFVAIDEKGTEAAAATGVIVGVRTTAVHMPPPEFKIDHPFIFAIRDVKRGRILFMGRVTNPKG